MPHLFTRRNGKIKFEDSLSSPIWTQMGEAFLQPLLTNGELLLHGSQFLHHRLKMALVPLKLSDGECMGQDVRIYSQR